MLDEGPERKTASSPRGPKTRSATAPTFPFSLSKEPITFAIPIANPFRFAKDVFGAIASSPLGPEIFCLK